MRWAIGPAMRATNMIGPATAVAKPIRTIATAMSASRLSSTCAPSAFAVSSPSSRTRSGRWSRKATGISTSKATSSTRSSVDPAWPTVPTSQVM